MSEWTRVSRSQPCPICGRDDWCGISPDGNVVRCMRSPSAKPSYGRDGQSGWLHFMGDSPVPVKPRGRQHKAPAPSLSIEEITRIADEAFQHPDAKAKRKALSKELGVSLSSLVQLRAGVGFTEKGVEYATFPARDSQGRIVGITRRFKDGSKRTLKGTSNSGVFYRCDWWKAGCKRGNVYVVEGPTDTAALIDRGVAVIGRPSNTGGITSIVAMLECHPFRTITVIGENDRKPDRVGKQQMCSTYCPGCSWCWPGKYGMERTAEAIEEHLSRSVDRMMPPPEFKDVREWLKGRIK